MYRIYTLLLAALLLGGAAAPAAQAQPAPAAPQASIAETPDALVAGGVSDFAVAASRVSWLTRPTCPGTPPGSVLQAETQAAADPVTVQRVPTYGGPVRLVFSRNDPRAAGVCNPYVVRSNIVADANNVYWLDASGLVRLPNSASPGDAPTVLNATLAGVASATLAIGETQVFVVRKVTSSLPIIFGIRVTVVDLATGASTSFGDIGDTVDQASFDGAYLYYRADGELRRWRPGDAQSTTLATNVRAYYAEGLRLCQIIQGCGITDRVFIARGGNSVVVYNNRTNTLGTTAFYTSPEPDATIFQLASDGNNLFSFEQRSYCDPPFSGCFANRFSRTLYRRRFSDGARDPIYNITVPNGITPPVINKLVTDGTFLFWDQTFALLKLPNNAAALPRVNMRVTDLEITQGIQNTSNSIRLIQNRRTFVRVTAKSDGASVAGVTMLLYGTWLGGESGAGLRPVNPVGTQITVWPNPNRAILNDSFMFELPWEWTTKSQLQLRAVLNPYRYPLQNSYANNELSSGPYDFQPSPRLPVQFVGFVYSIGGQTYRPRLRDDVLQTYSYIRRTYPLASTPGFIGDASPGFRPNFWYVDDDSLGARVDRSDSSCSDNLCAADYSNARLKAMRTEENLASNVFMYGMISDAAGYFPRGREGGGGNVSSGPAGVPGGLLASEPKDSKGNSQYAVGAWDTDTSYGDWYAAHEIGHSLGRPHPSSGSQNVDKNGNSIPPANCGHSRSGDLSYEHGDINNPRAPIGPSDNSVAGFDGGDREFGIAPAVLPSAIWNDVMSYCPNQWVSDYTYNALYDKLMAAPAASAAQSVRVSQAGDWLSVFGSIAQDGSHATIHALGRVPDVMEVPPRTPGGYSIRLLSAGGTQLADYPFTPSGDQDAAALDMGQVVPFVAGTRTVQIVRLGDGAVIATKPVSANPPTVSSVALVSPPNPVNGAVTLGWTASDQDGDALSFDIYYSRDNGTTFQPVRLGVTGSSTPIDTARLGGSGTAIFRAIASDGAQSATADSAPFTMADKAPQPRISNPQDGAHLHWGQLLNLSGEAEDFQDGGVASASLSWSTQRGALGTGALLTVEELPAGTNVITLTATNSAGVAASTSVTVVVDDDLEIPGPTLQAGPAQIGWSVADGETAAQTAAITISNSGGGTLSWTASSDAAWLTLDSSGGTAPATLTLRADPTQVAGGGARATLTISVAAGSGVSAQTLSIPVSLSKGDAHSGPLIAGPPTQSSPIYLPLVQR